MVSASRRKIAERCFLLIGIGAFSIINMSCSVSVVYKRIHFQPPPPPPPPHTPIDIVCGGGHPPDIFFNDEDTEVSTASKPMKQRTIDGINSKPREKKRIGAEKEIR